MPPSQLPQALQFATTAHAGQKRSSGEPFVTHLTAVVAILKEIGADEETLIAALLHDTLEDTQATAKQLKKEFGPVVTRLVEGVTKVERLEKTFDKRVRNMESLRKMFRVMGRDIRVLFIKLADRLHNMRTIDAVPPDKRVRIARETQDIYCPLASLLGVRAWFEELNDLSFAVLDPVEAELTRRKFAQTWKEQHRPLERWASRVGDSLRKAGIRVQHVRLRRRHLRAVRSFSVENEGALRQLESYHTLQITLRNAEDVYRCLGALHAAASAVPGGIDDYVSSPKVNGYRALHSMILSGMGNPITAVLQTGEMAEAAGLGLALLYRQSSAARRNEIPDWVEALLSLDAGEEDLQEFFMRVRSEIFGERSRVQIRAGRRTLSIDLPAYASVLDAAYYADPKLAAAASAAVINGKPAGLKHLLHDGDAVEIVRDGIERSADDLYCIHTALAHRRLVTGLSRLPRAELIRQGRRHLQHAMSVTMDPFFSIRWQKDVRVRITADVETLRNIGSGALDAFLFIETAGVPEDFFLLDPSCFVVPTSFQTGFSTRFVLRTSIDDLRAGRVVGVQAGPDVINVVGSESITQSRWKIFSREIVPLQLVAENAAFPFLFAIAWNFAADANPLSDIGALESFLDTPMRLLQFSPHSVSLGFRTDRLRTLQIAYKYLYSLPHISGLHRITPP